MKKPILALLAASALSAHGMTIAQFNPADPSVTPYLANGTPTPVSFDPGTPVNPTGTHFFTVSITNTLTASPPVRRTGLGHHRGFP